MQTEEKCGNAVRLVAVAVKREPDLWPGSHDGSESAGSAQ
jgi:hypothetical protein